jgi:mannose-6-phosphate isomerase-like protein (cupin superfamily)
MSFPIAPKVLRPGEGKYVVIGSGSRCTFKVVGADTHGHFGLFEFAMEPGAAGPKPHIHHGIEEIFYVVEGEIELLVGEEKLSTKPGTLALVPRGTVHAFANPGPNRSTLLIMFCPADSREQYFEGLAELTKGGKTPDQDALFELMRKFDQEPVEESEWRF